MTAVNHLDIVLISEVQSPAEEKMEEITSVGKERERLRPQTNPPRSYTLHPAVHVYLFCSLLSLHDYISLIKDSEIKILINLY